MRRASAFLAPLREVAQGVAWLSAASLLVKPVWFVFITVVCARALGAEGYGVLNTAIALATLAFSLTGFGMSMYTVREVAQDRTRAPRFLTNFTVLRGVLGVVATALAMGAAVALGYDRTLTMAVLMWCFYTATNGFNVLAHSFFQAFETLHYQALSLVGEKVLVIAGGAALLYATGSAVGVLGGLALGMALASLGTYALCLARTTRFDRSLLDWSFTGNALRSMVPFGVAGALGMFFFRVDNVMVEAFQGAAEAGRYGLGFRVVEALNLLPALVVHATAYPRLSRLSGPADARDFRRTMGGVGLFLIAVCVPISTVLYVFADSIVYWIAPNASLSGAAAVLRVLCWAFVLTSIRELFHVTLLARGEQGFIARALAVAVVGNVALNAVLIPRMGGEGAALATIASEALLLGAYLVRYVRVRPPGSAGEER